MGGLEVDSLNDLIRVKLDQGKRVNKCEPDGNWRGGDSFDDLDNEGILTGVVCEEAQSHSPCKILSQWK